MYISYKNYFYLIVDKIIITSFVVTCIKIILSKCCTNIKSSVKLLWPHKFFWMKTFDKVQMWTFDAYIDQFSAVIAVNMIDKHAPRFETRLDRFLLRRIVFGYSGCSWIILRWYVDIVNIIRVRHWNLLHRCDYRFSCGWKGTNLSRDPRLNFNWLDYTHDFAPLMLSNRVQYRIEVKFESNINCNRANDRFQFESI